jgi:hypothetical protein
LNLTRADSGIPFDSVKTDPALGGALAAFDVVQADTLAVTARGIDQVLGTLSETYAARHYAQETNLAMKGVLGGNSRARSGTHRMAAPLR